MKFRANIICWLLFIGVVGLTSVPLAAKEPPKSVDSLTTLFPDSLDVKGKVVYVDFWASWCQPCRKSFPFMEKLSQAHKSGDLVIVAVNLDKDSAAAAAFLAKNRASFTIVYDPDGSAAKRFSLHAIPTSFLYGRDGLLRETHRGFEPADTTELSSLIDRLLKEK